MQTLSNALIDLVLTGDVDRETAANAAPNRHDFLIALDHALEGARGGRERGGRGGRGRAARRRPRHDRPGRRTRSTRYGSHDRGSLTAQAIRRPGSPQARRRHAHRDAGRAGDPRDRPRRHDDPVRVGLELADRPDEPGRGAAGSAARSRRAAPRDPLRVGVTPDVLRRLARSRSRSGATARSGGTTLPASFT